MLTLESEAFQPYTTIPPLYTCLGKDISPPLSFRGAPKGTVSFVLICDDPDAPDPKAPKMVFVHWVVYNIPKETTRLEENYQGATQGQNDYQQQGYRGPCPPIGEHRYFFKLYALDTLIDLKPHATKQEVLSKMTGHILEEAVLVGLFKK
jgi:Raf kinase inhibitor-like YbhB/YbcL family protein